MTEQQINPTYIDADDINLKDINTAESENDVLFTIPRTVWYYYNPLQKHWSNVLLGNLLNNKEMAEQFNLQNSEKNHLCDQK